MNKEVKTDKELIAYCGLYCGACGKYMNDKCPLSVAWPITGIFTL